MHPHTLNRATCLLAAVAVSGAVIVGGCAKVERAEAPEETAAPLLAGAPIEASEVTELAVVGCTTCGGPRADGQSYLEYDGKQYGFCCPGCMELFRKDPAKFVGSEAPPPVAPADGGDEDPHAGHAHGGG